MAKAIAVVYQNPFILALQSARNFGAMVANFMYGNEARTKVTYAFALGLLVLSFFIEKAPVGLPVCAL